MPDSLHDCLGLTLDELRFAIINALYKGNGMDFSGFAESFGCRKALELIEWYEGLGEENFSKENKK